jgi:hypothetical protein
LIKFFCVFALLFISKEDRSTCPRLVPVLISTKLGKKDFFPKHNFLFKQLLKVNVTYDVEVVVCDEGSYVVYYFRVGVYDVIFLQRVNHITPAGSREEFFGRRLVPTQLQPPSNHGSIQCLQKVYAMLLKSPGR